MTRKPAQTEPDDQAKAAVVSAKDMMSVAAPSFASAEENDNTRRGGAAGNAAKAPDHAPEADEPGHAGGEDWSDLPATLPDMAIPAAGWVVTCHREGGRRRAGRRWDHGDTAVSDGELTDYQLAVLQGDPQFTLRKPAQD